MKFYSKALIGAIAIHGIYFMTTFAVGYVKTMNYKPDWEASWSNAEILQSEVSFGYGASPFLHIGLFLTTILACGIILRGYKKSSSKYSKTEVS